MPAIPPNTNYDGLLKSIRQGIDGVYQKGIKQGRYLEQQQRLMEKAKTGWVSAEDRLPEEEKDVLCYLGNSIAKSIVVAFVRDGEWRFNGWSCPTVTHWMPLPEPPKEDENA